MTKSDPRKAVEDLVHDIKNIFKQYTKNARQKSWVAVNSPNGKHLINKIIKDPSVPTIGLARLLNFKEWINNQS
jgi:hypothetical protein